MDIHDDALERYFSSNLPSFFAAHLSQGHLLSAWRTPLPSSSSRPISNEYFKSLSPNPPCHTTRPQQRQPIPPPGQKVSYPNVPNSRKRDWRVRNAFEGIST